MIKNLILPAILFLFCFFGLHLNSFSQQEPLLYFCEDYKDGKEINVATQFTTGWLTVMVDLRPAEETFKVSKVNILIYRAEYDADNKLKPEFIDKIPFNVQPDWDYVFFKNTDKLKFSSAGYYIVACQTEDEETIAYGVVEIVGGESKTDYLELGNTEFDNHNYNKAIEYYTKALDEDPNNADIYSYRAGAFDQAGRYDKAISDYKKCLTLSPGNEYALANIGWAYFHKKSYNEALTRFQDYDKTVANDVDTKLGLSVTYFMLKDYDECKTYLKQLIELVPEVKKGMGGITTIMEKYEYTYTDSDMKNFKDMLDYFGYK